ncbi:MAG TPA: DUF4236 domain-containing protein [Candidatus Binataceae bacterium]|nr:DUF4236 domain-containing protein [Candidatus Binataceae bacterium]
MNYRFHRRFKIFPNLNVVVSRSGPGITVGIAGRHVNWSRGRLTCIPGIPGSGIFVTSRIGSYSGFHSAHVERPVPPNRQRWAHRMGALATLTTILAAAVVVTLLVMDFVLK